MADYEDKEFEDFDELPPESLDAQNDQDDDEEEPTAKPSASRKTAQDWARDKRMSADVNGTTVGVATDRVTPELLLATSKKLLSVSRREAQPDQKDSLQFQRVYGPAEYFAEHVLRDGGKLGRNLLWKATNRGNLDFMQPGALDKHVSDVFYDSKLANMVDGSSPLELMDGAVKVTRLGEGGVGDTDSAPVEMRLVQPSFAGFVDPVRCYSPDTEVLTESGWVRVDQLNMSHRPAVLLDGETKFAPMEKDVFVQSYPGTLHVYDDGVISFIVTPGHRMHVRVGDEADYRIVHMSELVWILEKEPVFVRTGLEDNAEHRLSPDRFQLAAWVGDVFCPTVPGGLVYCRRNQGQGFWCGNSVDSFRIGLDAYFAKGLIKGSDGKLYRKMLNARTGKEELVDSVTAAKSVVTTPDMMESNTSSVYALGGDTGARIVDRKDVDYVLPRPDEMFSTAANVVPMLSGVKEMRLHMGCLHPSTPVVVYRKGWVDVIRACDMGNACETIGVDDDVEKMLPVRNTVSRFPTSRNCFRAVRLLSGRSLVTSDSHRWKVQRNGKWLLVTADKLKEGDVVLRSLYSSLPTRRPFVLGKYVTADFAYALGLACRSLTLTEKGKGTPRLECPADRIDAVVSALEAIGECQVAKYNHNGVWLIRVEAGELADWLVKNIGTTKETRKVPSCILSAGMMQSAAFIQGFTTSPDKSALDQEEDAWILGIDNSILRDGVAIVLSRLYTDTLYRDSREHGLCLQLQPLEADYSNMAVDVVKSVTKEKAAAYMVDVDVDDRLFATANGIVTHNSKYALQAVPLDKPAPQLVRSLDEESGKDMPSLIGKHLGALYAKKGGKVVAVRKDRIDVVYDDGSKASVPLYVNFPMNQKGYISSRPVVKAGQAFGKGDILAASNWTDDKGTAAIGAPLRTAWLSWKGGTYEDGIAISQSCAEKLRSTTMYSTSMDLDKTVRLGRNSFTSWKPDAFSKEQLENIGDDGIVKPGTVLKPGDPMILAVQTTEPGPGTLGKRILTDVSEKWEHDRPGVVTDVVRTRTGVKVLTTVSSPVEVGDKLSGSYGNKGVVSQIIPDDEMPQDKDGNPIDLLFSPLGLITRCYDADTEFRTKDGWKKGADVKPEDLLYTYDTRLRVWAWDKQVAPMHVSDYDGSMYRYADGNVDFLVTPHHRIWARVFSGGYSAYLVEDIFGMDCHIPYLGNNEAHLHASGWSRETYKGKIYCPSVETGYVQIRRNGKICVLGNTNASQLHEALLGKVAHKTGKPEIIPEFYKGDLMDYVNSRLKQARLSPEDDLVDPSTGKVLKGITNGYSYIYRLKHMAESKMSARGTDKYTADETPASGSYGGGKKYGNLEVSAMVGHGAFNALQDAQQIRGQSNADFWREVRTGGIPTMPGEPFVHKKFFDTLKASGVNVRRTQKGVSVFALTDSDVKEMAGPREVRTKDTFDAKNYTPMDGGLFGKDVFGPNGDKWGYIQLDEPLPNPVMEDPITRLLRMKKGDFEAVVAGEKEVDGMKSAADIKKRLSTIDLEQEAEKAKKEFKSSTRSKKDEALKRYRAVELMRRNGVNPAEYMLDRIPVLPPAYRPVSTHSGLTMVADSNYLYAQLMDARDDLRAAKDLPDEYAKEARASVYRKWKELVGLYEPENPKLKSKSIKGLLGWALGTGSSPKASAVQRKVIGTSVDTVGRGVVVPDPRIKLNEIGMPEKMAFDVMAPFVQRELVRSGYTPIDAMKMVKARDPRARRELLRVMETHPLQMNRAPTLHKLSIIGAKPVLVSGHAIHVNPSIVVPLAMDFDGNCVDFNSKIFLKISKSELDNVAFLDHIKSVADNSADNVLNEGKAMRVTKESKIVAHNVESNEPFYQIPIGEFPKAGVPVKDRNGADVYPVPSGLAVLSCNPVTGKSSWEKVSAFTHEAGCHTVKVTTGPKEVIITDNESLAVFDTETGRLIKVKPEDHQGRLIPQFRKDPVPFGTWGNRDLGWLFGAFLSDGWVTRSVVGYSKLEKKKRDEFVRIMRNYHDNFAVYEYAGSKGEAGKLGDSVKLHLSGPGLVAWWEETGLVPPTAVAGRTALNKEIPLNLLYVANEETLWGFLSGLLDGDGSFSKNTTRNNPRFGCRFSTSSEKLKDGVVLLCYRLGIRTSTTVTAPRNFSNTAYTVCLSTSDMKRNLDKLSCVGERELGIISEWKASPEALDKQDSVPVTAEEAAAIKREISSTGPTAQLWAGLKNKDKCIRLTRGTAMKHASLIREVAPSLWERLLNMDTVWYPVDKIEDAGIRDVYDLRVDSTKVYAVNNGLIVWDTVNLHVPVSDAAREDTRNRMFPERNLVAMRDRKIAYKPEKEYQQGLYVATRMKEGERPRIFDTLEEARAALRRGDIDVDDPIIINRK